MEFSSGTRLAIAALLLVTSAGAQEPESRYDKAIFLKPIPADDLASLERFNGPASGDVIKDKQFRTLLKSIVPDCMFHYGSDMALPDAFEVVLKSSKEPAQIRDGRYLTISGRSGPYPGGRGFLWIDLQGGIALGEFFFHPTNGEPTPTVTVFSRQVKEKTLSMKELPPEFSVDLRKWLMASRIPPVTTRYFIGGANRRILPEHDEDYCAPGDSGACEQMEADATEIDLNTAYYLDQVHYATNATAWMIVGADQIAWIHVREGACGVALPCRIRMTREHVHEMIGRRPVVHPVRR